MKNPQPIIHPVRSRLRFKIATSNGAGNRQRNANSGFTMVETLVAITVLAISVAGPLSIAFQGLRSAQLAKDQVTASYLAQEGIEFLRLKRDENYIAGTPTTFANLFNACRAQTGFNGCWVDMSENPSTWLACGTPACSAATENPMDFLSGLYGHAIPSSVDSKFSRVVRVMRRDIDGGGGATDEYLASSTVTWKTGPIDRSVVIEELITDWQKNI